MPKRTSKSKDENETAFSIVQQVTSEPKEKPTEKAKNPAAVALGRLGGLKGGKARAEKLSAKERKEIARAAAAVRWSKNLPTAD